MMIFPDADDDAPDEVKALAARITYDGFNANNFYAYYRRFRKNYGTDEACAAGFLALRKQDPCTFGLSNYCIWRGTDINGHTK